MTSTQPSMFRTPEGQGRYFAAYEATLALWPVPVRPSFRYKMFLPPVYRDEELAQVRAPTLLLVGGQEAVYDPQALQARAIQCVPHLETHLIPDGGHALNLDQPEKVNQHILAFLESEPPGA